MFAADVPPTLEHLLSPKAAEVRPLSEVGDVRLETLREDALAYGVRAGLARRSWEIRQILSRQERELDRVFDFRALLMDQNVLPPVLTEARDVVSTEGTDTIRVTDRVYAIVQQARFVTAAPTWRDYLLSEVNYSYQGPDGFLRPRTAEERAAFDAAIRDGWSAGIAQADAIFSDRLSRLQRDFAGMVLYRTLLSRGMVSRPFVAEARYGITGNSEQVNINERVLKITAMPALQTPSAWKPIAVPASPIRQPEASR